jgi:hypothetical protein
MIAALAGALGAFDAEYVKLALDVTESKGRGRGVRLAGAAVAGIPPPSTAGTIGAVHRHQRRFCLGGVGYRLLKDPRLLISGHQLGMVLPVATTSRTTMTAEATAALTKPRSSIGLLSDNGSSYNLGRPGEMAGAMTSPTSAGCIPAPYRPMAQARSSAGTRRQEPHLAGQLLPAGAIWKPNRPLSREHQ